MVSGSNEISVNGQKPMYTTVDNIFPYTQVAREIGEAQGWSKSTIDDLCQSMLEAITSQPPRLLTRNRLTGLPNPEHDVFWHLVHPDDVNEWLKGQGLDYRWGASKSGNTTSITVPVPRAAAQDAAILCEIKKQGYNPLGLPKNDPGKPGVKAAIRAALVGNNPLFPKAGKQFDKAWDRLRASREVADKG